MDCAGIFPPAELETLDAYGCRRRGFWILSLDRKRKRRVSTLSLRQPARRCSDRGRISVFSVEFSGTVEFGLCDGSRLDYEPQRRPEKPNCGLGGNADFVDSAVSVVSVFYSLSTFFT